MPSEAEFGTATVRYASVDTGFWGRAIHGRARTSPRTGAKRPRTEQVGAVGPTVDRGGKLAYLLVGPRIRTNDRAKQLQCTRSLLLAEPTNEQLQPLPCRHTPRLTTSVSGWTYSQVESRRRRPEIVKFAGEFCNLALGRCGRSPLLVQFRLGRRQGGGQPVARHLSGRVIGRANVLRGDNASTLLASWAFNYTGAVPIMITVLGAADRVTAGQR